MRNKREPRDEQNSLDSNINIPEWVNEAVFN